MAEGKILAMPEQREIALVEYEQKSNLLTMALCEEFHPTLVLYMLAQGARRLTLQMLYAAGGEVGPEEDRKQFEPVVKVLEGWQNELSNDGGLISLYRLLMGSLSLVVGILEEMRKAGALHDG